MTAQEIQLKAQQSSNGVLMQPRMSLKPNVLFYLYQFADSLSGFTVRMIFKPS
jgi:hypothetical protein